MASPVLQFKRGNIGVAATIPALRPGEPAFTLDKFDLFVGLDTSVAGNKFFGSHRYWKREDATNAAQLRLVDKDGSNYIAIAASDTLAGVATYRLPNTTDGTAGDYLKLTSTTGGYYDLEWAAIPSGSFTITGDSGTDTFTTGGTLNFAGTAGEIQTTVTNDQVQIGLPDNVVVGGALTVTTNFAVNGNVTLGDNTSDDITVGGEFVSSLNPSTTNTYDLGTSSQRWRNVWVSGNLNVAGIITSSQFNDLLINNKDIVVAYTDGLTETDTTANHGGIAVASTEGTPLFDISVAGINTLPSTYKQIMWVKDGTFSGLGTDAWMFNYGVAIGTSTMASGVRLAVGTGVTVTDTEVSATTFRGSLAGNADTATSTATATTAEQVETVTASNLNATHYLTFVDSHNGSATAELVYTDDGIYYNPGTNTFTTQHALFTGNVEVQGTLTGTATTATTVNTTATSTNASYYVTFVDTLAGETGETIRVGAGVSINPSTGNVGISSILSVGDSNAVNAYIKAGGGSNAMYLYGNGDVSFQSKVITNSIRSASDSNNALSLAGRDVTFGNNIIVSGIATIGTGIGVTQFTSAIGSGTSTSSVPTSSAVIDYIGSQLTSVDLTTGIAGDTGTGTVNTSQTLTIAGTAGEIETSASGQTITVGLPDTVIVGTALSAPTVKTATIQHSNGTQAATIDTSGNITASQNLTVSGNLYVSGSTTQVNTDTLTVEDRTIELGMVGGSAPGSATTWDLGVLFNYNSSGAKKSAVIWEHADGRFKFGSQISDGGGTDNDSPQITVSNYAAIEIGSLWVNDCAGQSQVINCSGTTRTLENITIDAGTF